MQVVQEWSKFLQTAHQSHRALCDDTRATKPRPAEPPPNPWAYWELRDLLVAVQTYYGAGDLLAAEDALR